MAPASKLSKRTPLSDASSDDDDSSSDSGSDSGLDNGMKQETFPEIKIDVTQLNPLSPEVIQKQATINIGALFASALLQPAMPVHLHVEASRQSKAQKADLASAYATCSLFIIAGTIGHVAHGKSTVVKAISGVQTVRFKNELERNITIKLGYANAKVRLNGRVDYLAVLDPPAN